MYSFQLFLCCDYKNGHPRGKSKRFGQQPSRKVNCSAVMRITVTTSFPEYCIPESTTNIRKMKAKVSISIVNSQFCAYRIVISNRNIYINYNDKCSRN